MKRCVEKFAEKTYDVVIIGGGIYGAWAAWDAAIRGFSVALVEKDDFGANTSSNSLKIIHGGLRYLQHADLKRMRESIHERQVLMYVAPHLVHPLPCVMPTYGHGLKGREVMALALFLNDLVGYDRNALDDPQKHLPDGKIIPIAEVRRLLPGIDEQGLTGGAVWYDCQVYNSERLLISLLHGAVARGAEIANYMEATGLLRTEGRISGVRARDRITGTEYPIRGRMVLNAGGPWMSQLMRKAGLPAQNLGLAFSKAMNLIINRPMPTEYAAGIPSKFAFRDADSVLSRGSRLLFLTPWRKYTLLGTTHLPYEGEPHEFAVTEADILEFLEEYNQAYPARRISRHEVIYYYAGLLPMEPARSSDGHVTLTKQYKIIDHAVRHGLSGLVSVLGVKYTTARDVAAKAVDLVGEKLGRPIAGTTAKTRIPGGEIDRFGEFMQQVIAERPRGLEADVVRHLIYNFGSDYRRLLAYSDEDIRWREPVTPAHEVLGAEVIHAIREEMAISLLDVIRRRTELGSAGCPDAATLRKTAALMARELGWDAVEIQEQIAAAAAYYRPAPARFPHREPAQAPAPPN